MINSAIALSASSFGCVLGGALLGSALRPIIPVKHLHPDAKDVIKLGLGLVGMMVSIVLGMMIASAKGSFDTQTSELAAMSARIVLVDRALTYYGPEANDARLLVRGFVTRILETMWSKSTAELSPAEQTKDDGELIREAVARLVPKNDSQRLLQGQILNTMTEIGITRWLMYEQKTAMPVVLLGILILWLTIIFVVYGLFTPPNVTVFCCLVVFASTVSGAVFLIEEMYSPYTGVIRISKAPLEATLAHIGK
jgi:hypothetical protein